MLNIEWNQSGTEGEVGLFIVNKPTRSFYGESFRGGGGAQKRRTDLEISVIRPVFHR